MAVYALRLLVCLALTVFFVVKGWEVCAGWLVFAFIVVLFYGHPKA